MQYMSKMTAYVSSDTTSCITYPTYLAWAESYMHRHYPGEYSPVHMPIAARERMLAAAGVVSTHLYMRGIDVYVSLNIADARKFITARLTYNM